jgi:predicted NAD/FAD-binding protein
METPLFHQKKIAVIGSGISGLGFAYIAKKNNIDVTLFEQNETFGGHSNTIDLTVEDQRFAVDTGFLVHNRLTYPNLIELFEQLGIDIVDTEMTLSIQVEDEKLEWGGTNLDTVFAQRKNLFSPRFHHFLIEILRFNREASNYLIWANQDTKRTLADLLKHFGYSKKIEHWYLIPMAAAIWSTPANKILEFPAHTFLTFSLNHHLLQVNNRPVWRTIRGGSRTYVKKITDLISDKRLNHQITGALYRNNQVHLSFKHNEKEVTEVYDYVLFAGHADQTLSVINEIDEKVKNVLSAFRFEKNIAYVHSDETFLPEREKLWSAWNYVSAPSLNSVSVSYLINKLQPLPVKTPVIVTLNPHKNVDEKKLHRIIHYTHPLFDSHAILKQKEIPNIQGVQNMFFAGAWSGYGFHEDGLKSAVALSRQLGLKIPWRTSP